MKFATLAIFATTVSAVEDEAALDVIEIAEEQMKACGDCENVKGTNHDEPMTCGTVTIGDWSKEGCQRLDKCGISKLIEDSEAGLSVVIECTGAKLFATAVATFSAIVCAI